jgi:ubiquinone/menaquinone biosynthesis C-methylase UbiE
MNAAEYALMDRLEADHWYFVGKRELLQRTMRRALPPCPNRRVLDVGCGTGKILEMLQRSTRALGTDHSAEALTFCRVKGLTGLVRADAAGALPFRDGQLDTVFACDVIEHLVDERPVLREICRLLKREGTLIVTVPAMQFLWSQHDVALGHYRRYHRDQLAAVLAEAGFHVDRVSYFNTLLFPVACAVRLLRRRANGRDNHSDFIIGLPAAVNALFLGCLRVEAWFLDRWNFPFGLSLIAVASPSRTTIGAPA